MAAAGVRAYEDAPRKMQAPGRLSVVIAGHNKEDSFERCAAVSAPTTSGHRTRSSPSSDGSTDRTPEKLGAAQRRGLIQEARCQRE